MTQNGGSFCSGARDDLRLVDRTPEETPLSSLCACPDEQTSGSEPNCPLVIDDPVHTRLDLGKQITHFSPSHRVVYYFPQNQLDFAHWEMVSQT
jgi:hypothetical protein